MIFEVLEILAQQVESYTGKDVTLGNVAQLDELTGQNSLKDTIILSLINFSEAHTMKNFPNTRSTSSGIQTKQPIINLNLYVLFSISKNYDISLRDLSKIIEFFQGKKVFTQSNSTYNHNDPLLSALDNFKFHVELYTPTFEEQNYMWGNLGGKQLPSALYKLSIIQIESDEILTQSGEVGEFNQNANQL